MRFAKKFAVLFLLLITPAALAEFHADKYVTVKAVLLGYFDPGDADLLAAQHPGLDADITRDILANLRRIETKQKRKFSKTEALSKFSMQAAIKVGFKA